MTLPERVRISNRVLWWVVTTLTALATGSYATSTLNTTKSLDNHAQRIATVEADVRNGERALDRIDRNVQHIVERLSEWK